MTEMTMKTYENPQYCSFSEPVALTMLNISVATVAVETWDAAFSALISASFPKILLLTYKHWMQRRTCWGWKASLEWTSLPQWWYWRRSVRGLRNRHLEVKMIKECINLIEVIPRGSNPMKSNSSPMSLRKLQDAPRTVKTPEPPGPPADAMNNMKALFRSMKMNIPGLERMGPLYIFLMPRGKRWRIFNESYCRTFTVGIKVFHWNLE